MLNKDWDNFQDKHVTGYEAFLDAKDEIHEDCPLDGIIPSFNVSLLDQEVKLTCKNSSRFNPVCPNCPLSGLNSS